MVSAWMQRRIVNICERCEDFWDGLPDATQRRLGYLIAVVMVLVCGFVEGWAGE